MKNLFFDKNFYLIANPDVLEANIDAKYHYKNYGKSEGRISSKKHCKKTIYPQKYSEISTIIRLLIQKYGLTINSKIPIIKYNLPWRINNEGYPNTIYEFQIRKINSSQTTNFDSKIIYFEKKRKSICYFANYEF